MSEKLERSVLLVPASNWSMIQKTAASKADAVCIDLEDAVTVDEKEASRANVARAFKELDFGGKLRMFRINGLDTHYAYRDLIEVVEAAGDCIDLIVVLGAPLQPKRAYEASHYNPIAKKKISGYPTGHCSCHY